MNEGKMVIKALVVTRNRKELLKECIAAIKAQTTDVDEIIVIDNDSTDGSYDYLLKNDLLDAVDYHLMESNLGGAGGFSAGIGLAMKKSFDLLWIMDDDVLPKPDCLDGLISDYLFLLKNGEKNISFIASTVFGEHGEVMNAPCIDGDVESNGYPGWYRYLNKGLVKISYATFVSLLIDRDAIEKCGLPCRDYFIWGDDIEYTLRLTHYYGPAFFSGNSIAVHRRVITKPLDILIEDDPNRIELFHHYYRNHYINSKYYKLHKMVTIRSIFFTLKSIVGVKGVYKIKKIKQLVVGCIEGIILYTRYKRIIDEQIDNKDKGK